VFDEIAHSDRLCAFFPIPNEADPWLSATLFHGEMEKTKLTVNTLPSQLSSAQILYRVFKHQKIGILHLLFEN
jgi:hypothetical protein